MEFIFNPIMAILSLFAMVMVIAYLGAR